MNDARWAEVEAVFRENFETRGELGAAVSVWRRGLEVVNLASGFCDRRKSVPWEVETPVLIWSATKGAAAASLLHLLDQRGIPLETRVRDWWPEFGQAGKEAITIAEVVSHRAGLAALPEPVDVFDHEAVVRALASQPPEQVGSHGYHPRTIGFMMDELVRRMAGVPLGQYWEREFAGPMELDFWIGLSPEKVSEVAPVFPARVGGPLPTGPFYEAFAQPGSLTQRAFSSPRGLHSVAGMNTPAARQGSFPAFGGIATAHALGKFYAMLADGGSWQGRRFFSPDARQWMKTTLTTGVDEVLRVETAFSAGFMKDVENASGGKARQLFGPSTTAFGHPGAGGSLAFADPENGISFAYVMNQMEPGVLPGGKALQLVEAVYETLN